jgi:hypothetical protein
MRNQRFEQWFSRHVNVPLSEVRAMFDGRTYRSYDWHVETAWAAWCAALGFDTTTEENEND